MAKIYGVQVKGIKEWEAMEGTGIDANIYIDNKKVGRYYDAGNGGMPDVIIDNPEHSKVLTERVKQYFIDHPVDRTGLTPEKLGGKSFEERYDFMMDDVAFIEEVISMTQNEKFFKKSQKQGYSILVVCDYPFFVEGPHPYIQPTMFGGRNPVKSANDFIMEKKAKFPHLIHKTYSTLEDFIIEKEK